MDLLAILLLMLPAIFKLIGEKNKKNKNKHKNNNNDPTIPNWLSRLRDEMEILLDSKDMREEERHRAAVYETSNVNQDSHNNVTAKTVETILSTKDISLQSKAYDLKTKSNSHKNEDTESEIYDDFISLDFTGEEILKSIIVSEILSKPVSKRGAR